MKFSLKLLAMGMALWLGTVVHHAQATHLVGSDIVYQCLGNGKYKITVRVYRDCNGIALSQSPIVLTCGSNTITINNQTKVRVRDVTGLNPNCNKESRCKTASFPYGIEEHVYEATVDLSSYNCCEWQVSWQQNARGSNISTGQANQNFYTYATLNKCVTPCNSSPDFTNPPVAIVCRGEDFIFNNGALDTLDSGDSLSYHLAPAMINANTMATYIPPFSYQSPITFFGSPFNNLPFPAGFHVDPVTGTILTRPMQQNEVGIIVIEVKEWRRVNGVMQVIGVTRRDMQIIVVNCPNNNTPTIEPPYSVEVCARQQACIDITTDDEDQNDTVRISWNQGIPGATFTNNNGTVKHASGKVCWTPDDSHVSNIPYTFTITARDNGCDFPGQSVRAFSVFVRETPKAERHIELLDCGLVSLDYTLEKQYAGLTGEWVIRNENNVGVYSSGAKTDTAFLQPGIHRVFLSLQTATPCINLYIDSIEIPDFVQIALPEDTTICEGTTLNLPTQVKTGSAPFSYEWAAIYGDSVSDVLSTAESYSISPDSSGILLVRILDDENCRNYDTISYTYNKNPDVDLGPDQRICDGDSYTFSAGADSLFRFEWSTGDTTAGIDVNKAGKYSVRVIDDGGCFTPDTVELLVNEVPVDAGPNQSICDGESVDLEATGGDSYQWMDLEGFKNGSTPVLSTADKWSDPVDRDKGYIVRATKTEFGLTCTNIDSVKVKKRELPQVNILAAGPYCQNETPLNLNSFIQYPTLTNGDWRSDQEADIVQNGMLIFSNIDQPNPTTGHELIYKVTDQFGCTNESKVQVPVNPKPTIQLTDMTEICGDADALALNNIRQIPISTLGGNPKWYSATNNTLVNQQLDATNLHNVKFNVQNLPQDKTYPLVFEFTSAQTGCTNKDTARIKVKTVPIADAGTISPLCFNDDPIDLYDGGASPNPGTWSSPDATLNGSNFDPSSLGAAAQYVKPGTQVQFFYTTELDGCFHTDSTSVLVKGIPQLGMFPVDGWCESAGLMDLSDKSNLPGGTWTGNGVTGNNFDPTLAGLGQSHNLTYSYTDPVSGCMVSDGFQVFAQEQPEIEILSETEACAGESLEIEMNILHAGGGLWTSSGDGNFDAQGGNNSSTILKTTYYPGQSDLNNENFILAAVTTDNGYCPEAKATKAITLHPLPSATIEADALAGCAPLIVAFKANTDAQGTPTYLWDFGDGSTSSQAELTRRFETSGQYPVNLTVISAPEYGSCEQAATQVIADVWPTPVAAFTANRFKTTVALPQVQFTDQSTIVNGGTLKSWSWSFGDKNNSGSTVRNPFFEYPVDKATDTGTFPVQLTVTSENGCWDTITHYVTIQPDLTVFIPNAFTPDGFGVGINNRFYVQADSYSSFEIRIFNRWGEQVYYSTDIEEGWDGKYKGVEAQQDVYMYTVTVYSLEGKEYNYHGTVTLLR